MSINELHSLQHDFVLAAQRAKKAGFDGIELHGAHGYLLNQFASPITNHREDEYGGNMENRLRFVKEIIENIRYECYDFIIGYRMGMQRTKLKRWYCNCKALGKTWY